MKIKSLRYTSFRSPYAVRPERYNFYMGGHPIPTKYLRNDDVIIRRPKEDRSRGQEFDIGDAYPRRDTSGYEARMNTCQRGRMQYEGH